MNVARASLMHSAPIFPDFCKFLANWPESIQNSWPYFIMGVSLMWLDLVEQTVDPNELGSRLSVSKRLKYYKEIDNQITALWKHSGRHAFFHHISGLYGYEPLDFIF